MLLRALIICLLDYFVLLCLLFSFYVTFYLRFGTLFLLIAVFVFDFLGFDAFEFIALGESRDSLAQDFLDSWQSEEEEGVCYSADIKSLEGENERKLVFLVVSDEGDKSLSRFVDQTLVS